MGILVIIGLSCVGFESIHYDLDAASSFKVFNEFNYVFLLNVLLI